MLEVIWKDKVQSLIVTLKHAILLHGKCTATYIQIRNSIKEEEENKEFNTQKVET